jgi:hypothetical protein
MEKVISLAMSNIYYQLCTWHFMQNALKHISHLLRGENGFGGMSLRERGLWRVVVDSKYGSSWGGGCSSEPIGAYGMGLWKNIWRGWEKFCSHTKFEVEVLCKRNGESVDHLLYLSCLELCLDE